MKRAILIGAWLFFAFGSAASHAAPRGPADIAARKPIMAQRLSDAVDDEFTAGGSISSDVLQAVGQAVLKKAVRAGWAELETKLSSLAGCSKTPQPLPSTCNVLGQARIEDLIASPKTLLNAFLSDLMRQLSRELDQIPLEIKAPVAAVLAGWVVFGSDSAASHLRPWLKKQIAGYAGQIACPQEPYQAVAWVLGECTAQDVNNNTEIADLPTCDFTSYADRCTQLDGSARYDVVQVAQLAGKALTSSSPNSCPKDDKRCVPHTWIQLFFDWTQLAFPKQKPVLGGLEDLLLGLVDRDWTRAVIGIGHVAVVVDSKDCHPCKIEMKLVKIIGAVGQFAETYKNQTPDPTGAREKVIEDLVTSLVDRSERDHGAVISLGGAVGLFGGSRFNSDGHQIALPVHLTLGLGLDTYGAGTGGFHLSLDAFDLGQYVTYSSGSLDVGSPDLKSSVIAGATLTYWFASRETPIFVGFRGAVSPFVKTTAGKMTYELGATLGIYVPLLDFN